MRHRKDERTLRTLHSCISLVIKALAHASHAEGHGWSQDGVATPTLVSETQRSKQVVRSKTTGNSTGPCKIGSGGVLSIFSQYS